VIGELRSTEKHRYVIAILFDRSDRVKEISICDSGNEEGPPPDVIRTYRSKTKSWEVERTNFGPMPIRRERY